MQADGGTRQEGETKGKRRGNVDMSVRRALIKGMKGSVGVQGWWITDIKSMLLVGTPSYSQAQRGKRAPISTILYTSVQTENKPKGKSSLTTYLLSLNRALNVMHARPINLGIKQHHQNPPPTRIPPIVLFSRPSIFYRSRNTTL